MAIVVEHPLGTDIGYDQLTLYKGRPTSIIVGRSPASSRPRSAPCNGAIAGLVGRIDAIKASLTRFMSVPSSLFLLFMLIATMMTVLVLIIIKVGSVLAGNT